METVSTIIPTYNRALYLREAISSVLQQTTRIDQIIVVDDGSTDNTRQVVASFGEPVRYLFQPNAGPSAARNRGLREAKGTFITFLDSDDLWPPEKTRQQLAFLKRHPDVDFVFADMANFRDAPAKAAREIKNPAIHQYLVQHSSYLEDLHEHLIIENVVPTPTVMCRREALDRVGHFNEALRIAEDLDLWLRAAEVCRWGFVDEVHLLRRRHDSNLIADTTARNLSVIAVLEAAERRIPSPSPRLLRLVRKKCSSLRYDVGCLALRKSAYSEALKHLHAVCTPASLFWRSRVRLLQTWICMTLAPEVSPIALSTGGHRKRSE